MPKDKQPTRISERARAVLVARERRMLSMYEDQGGLPTIGIGHLLTEKELDTGLLMIDGEAVSWKRGISIAQSNALFDQDLSKFAQAVGTLIVWPLKQCQFDALVSFSFNTGYAALRDSTLRKKINRGLLDEVPEQFRRWNKVTVNGEKVVSKGLANRREEEIGLWLGEGYPPK